MAIPSGFTGVRAADVGGLTPGYDINSETRIVTIGLNKSIIVELPRNASEVLVSNPEYVDAVIRSNRSSYLIGKKVGQTNVFYFDAQDKRILSLDIQVERDLAGLHDLFHRYIPGARIVAEAVNDNIVLTGNVPNASAANRAHQIAARFIGDGEGKKILNLLTSDSKDQVLLKVTIAEMQRTAIKQLGINLAGALSIGAQVVNLQTAFPFSVAGAALGGITGGFGTKTATSAGPGFLQGTISGGTYPDGGSAVGGVIQAMEQNGLLRTLAEPNLTAVSGETAKFLAGGEFPVPVGRDDEGRITIEFKPFGVGLTFTPVVLTEGRISMKISTEVSELTSVGAFTLGTGSSSSLSVPGLKVRRANTTVEIPSGGSLVMAGLIKDDVKKSLNGLPGAKNIPILGALFRSRDFHREETELVVIVTPYIVRPVARGKLARPDEGYREPTDKETVLLGRLNSLYGLNGPTPVSGSYRGAYGFIVE